jgi:hypothetical protein
MPLLIIFPGATLNHWWNAIFAHLTAQNDLYVAKENSEQVNKANTYFSHYYRPISPDLATFPLASKRAPNRIFRLSQPSPFTRQENGAFSQSDDGTYLLIGLSCEWESHLRKYGLDFLSWQENEPFIDEVASYHLRRLESMEWLLAFIEENQQANNGLTPAITVPLNIVAVSGLAINSNLDQLARRYQAFLKRLVVKLLPRASLYTLTAEIKENPGYKDVLDLSSHVKRIIK